MARRTKDAPGRVTPKGGGRATPRGTGRVTPKGTQPAAARGPVAAQRAAATATPSGRYTAPIPEEYRSSPWWVPAIMLGFFGLGVLAIVLNYLSLVPASPSNWYLLGGLAGIVAGFVAATQYH